MVKNIIKKMKKLTIKDIFTEDVQSSPEAVKEVTGNENRMTELIKSFDEKNEIIKESKPKKINQKKIKQESEKNKQYAGLNEWGSVNQFNGKPTVNGMSSNVMAYQDRKETVNTFLDINNNPNSMKPYNPNYTYLQQGEALRLAISRALNSGAPVNGLGLYEEVNQILNGLGFNANGALDIKQAILKMIKD
jgi:hypothetical protein